MTDQWTSKLSLYLDGALPAAERQALEAHLGTCAECGRTLDELRRVVARAAALDDQPPARDLWVGVAQRIGVSVARPVAVTPLRPRRRFAFTMPQLAAAAVVLISASGVGVWMAMQSGTPAAFSPQPTADGRQPSARPITWLDSTASYDASVAELQQALAQGRTRLDTATQRVIEENLRIIDRAIAQARAALAADPASTYLNMHLAQTMRTKLELLRRAQAIATRS